jgi:hypothetical protein
MTKSVSDPKKEPCCTWKEDSTCEDCTLKDSLNCRWDKKKLLRFLYILSPAFLFIAIGTVWGAIKLSNWWWLGVIIGYYALFFIVETRILCSHCPYYSEEGKILHCLANQGFIKYVKYHPEPMNKFEKVLLQIGFVLFAVVPISNQVVNVIIISLNRGDYSPLYYIGIWIILGLSIISLFAGFWLLFTTICPSCVNFSCPFNAVAKEEIDEYLRKNPTMMKAWEECGYKLDKE